MEHVWTVICRISLTNQETNNLSLIETLERVAFHSSAEHPEPAENARVSFVPPVYLVSMWWRSDLGQPEQGRARTRVISPRNDELPGSELKEYSVDLQIHSKLRVIGTIEALPFWGDGVYRFQIEFYDEATEKWVRVARIPLEIVLEVPKD